MGNRLSGRLTERRKRNPVEGQQQQVELEASDASQVPEQQDHIVQVDSENPDDPNVLVSELANVGVKHGPKLRLEWEDLNFSVMVRKGFRKEKKQILFGITGYAEPGTMLSIMGASGAGKTTFLNLISGVIPLGRKDGKITVNGGKDLPKNYTSMTAYVRQNDIFLPHLSVWQTMIFASKLRLPSSVSAKDRKQRAEIILKLLGLDKTKNTAVGAPGVRKGISGGERKRLAIGVELLGSPSVLFLDEPTTGLDAASAYGVISILNQLAKSGVTVIMTIHQPRSNIYFLFDKLLLLAGGKVAYYGPAGFQATQFFTELGYPIPEYFNPADHLMDMVTVVPTENEEKKRQTIQRIQRTIETYNVNFAAAIPEAPNELTDQKLKVPKFQSKYLTQLYVIYMRSTVNLMKNRPILAARFGQTVILGFILGITFLQIADTSNTIQDRIGALFIVVISTLFNSLTSALALFPPENAVFLRERAANAYHVSSFYLGKILAELPYNVLMPIAFGSFTYWLMLLRPEPGAFFTFILILILLSLVGSALGQAISAAAPSEQVANALGPLIVIVLLLYAGFYKNANNLPGWLVWLYWLSFFHYAFNAAAINEFQGRTFECIEPPCFETTGEEVLVRLAADKDPGLWADIAILASNYFFFLLIGLIALKLLQRPKGA